METETKPKLTGRGGKGRGGGRKKGQSALVAIKIREMMAIELEKRFRPILEAQLDAAQGIQTEAYDKKTGKLYYKDPGPDVNAFKHLVDHVIGRPKESIDIGNTDNKPFIIKLDR